MAIISHSKEHEQPQTTVVDAAEVVKVDVAENKGDLIPTVSDDQRSALRDLAHRYGMEPKPFQQIIMEQCFKTKSGEKPVSFAEFAAFILQAKNLDLNPLAREIYGFRGKNGQIVPIVPIDGWARLWNRHDQMDGMDFDDHVDDKGNLFAVTCRIHRKDRAHPMTVTEYMNECYRKTEPWERWPRRMLRHKAAIQAARYAFSLGGIFDPDEAERMGVDVSPMIQVNTVSPAGAVSDPSGPPSARRAAATAVKPPSQEQPSTPEHAYPDSRGDSPQDIQPQVPLDGEVIAPTQPTAEPANGNGHKNGGPPSARRATGAAIERAKAQAEEAKAQEQAQQAPTILGDPDKFIKQVHDSLAKIQPGPDCADEFAKISKRVDVRIGEVISLIQPHVEDRIRKMVRSHELRLGLGG